MLGKRKNTRQHYKETNDEENDGERRFNLMEQVKSKRFEQLRDTHLLSLNGQELTLKLIQRNGFDKPILVEKPDGLDLLVPPKSFIVRDVRNHVGHHRIIDVMDVKTQKNIEMSMKDWCKYYESKHREKLLNVISLEFSHTRLDELVEAPLIVRLLDWVDLVWPKFLKQSQVESTNSITSMKYPKVQKYCLMSVKGSYTDFHIDFGGTSVWYHILRGKKIFWMVPPTELNLQIFEEWTLSGMQQDVFFGDTVEECFRVELCTGNTFFIPSGWIHAVYTLEDSLVFGGNFLHSFGMENQLKVSKIEDATKVPHKFRYPFYTEILWYVVQHYVYCLTDKDHLHRHELEAMAAKEKQLAEAALLEKNNNKIDNIEIEDETTESEHDDSDNNSINKKKTKQTPSSKSKKRSKASSKKGASKKKKPTTPPSTEEDDDETDIDSSNEELYGEKPNKLAANTCRMTKNSLLRLQYEVEDDKNQQKEHLQLSPNKSTTSSSSGKSPAKKKINTTKGSAESSNKSISSTSPTISAQKKQQQISSATINLAEIMLSQNESKLNGWSSGVNVGQTIWSNPSLESKEPPRIHITKYEVNGLKILVKHLSKLSGAKKNLPNLIRNSRALLDDCRKLIVEHENDDSELAITGKPITPELLRQPKTTDMNELIGQFFKPSADTTGNDDISDDNNINNNNSKHATLSSTAKSKFESGTTSTYNKCKSFMNFSEHLNANSKNKEDEKISNNFSSSNDNASGLSSTASKSSPHKETKCLSPKKFSSTATSSSVNNSSPPPKPKSPPTRPLSNNQYTSKTAKKFSVNLDLPGSFKDLIAATSSAKEAFDVKGSDVASTLFGATKDLASTKSASQSSKQANNKNTGSKPISDSMKSPLDIITSPSLVTVTSSTASNTGGSSIGTGFSGNNHNKEAIPSPNFGGGNNEMGPVKKRFINPHSIRPQQPNKEKLFYASAPYVSPDNVAEKRPKNIVSHLAGPLPVADPLLRTATSLTASNSGTGGTGAGAGNNHNKEALPTPNFSSNNESAKVTVPVKKRFINQQPIRPQQPDKEKLIYASAPYVSPVSVADVKPSSVVSQLAAPQPVAESSPKIATSSTASDSATSGTGAGAGNNHNNEAQPSLNFPANNEPTKVTGPVKKRFSKPQSIKPQQPSKEELTNPAAPPPYVNPINVPEVRPQNHLYPWQTPSTSANGTLLTQAGMAPRIGQQQYMITRPLLFNTMPTFSTAQFQQMSRAQMPLFTAPMGSRFELPLQQGARIVWATQPRGMPPTPTRTPLVATTTASISSQTMTHPTLTTAPMCNPAAAVKALAASATTHTPKTAHQQDNAALLSLATTALSTAPMTSSPALSHLSSRVSAPQAIMMSSAASQPALFAAATGQQFFRHPYLQRLPVTQFVTQPTTSRPTTGQLVYARLPNQTSQPRYLITQPGFMQPRFAAGPPIVTSQPGSTLAYVTFKNPATDSSKAIKTKKVKTS